MSTLPNDAPPLPPFLRRLPLLLALTAIAVGLALEFTVLRGYASHWWNRIPAFYLLWGAAGSAALLAAASFGARFLTRTQTEESHD